MMLDKNKPILVTGGTGFVGFHLTELLVSEHFESIHLTGLSPEAPDWVQNLSSSGVVYHQIDLVDSEATLDLFKKVSPEYVVHLASLAAVQTSFEQFHQVLSQNQTIQLSVLEAVRLAVPQALVLAISSAEVYGSSSPSELPINELHPLRPMSPYGVSKVTQDMLSYYYSQYYNLKIIRARPFNHIGEMQTPAFAVPAFVQQIVAIEQGKQETLQVGNLNAVRDFTDVKDMVAAYLVLLQSGVPGEVYNCGSGRGVSMQELLDQLCAMATVPITPQVDPTRVRAVEIPEIVCDATKLRALGWEATIPLNQTLKRILEWQRQIK